MKKLIINLVGAYDRFNYGDMLFPYIIEYILDKNFISYELTCYGLRKSDFTKVGAKETKRMAEMPMDGYVIVAGGDTMVANIQFLYLDNIESKIQLLFERFIRKILGGNYVQLVKKRTQIDNSYPYDIDYTNTIYNAVGGCGLNEIADSDFVKSVILKAKYIGVRDIATKRALDNCNVKLVPDTVTIISDIWKYESLKAELNNKYIELRDKYIVIQIHGKVDEKSIDVLKEITEELYMEKNMKVVLLPLGRAISHGDVKGLKKLHRKTQEICYFYDNISLREITMILACSEGFIGTSLHGNIVTCSYGKKSILLAEENSKNWWYWKTWWQNSNCELASFDNLKEKLKSLFERYDSSKLQEQKELVYKHFQQQVMIMKKDLAEEN